MSVDLQSVVALTDRVHDAMNDGDWARAHELEVERRALLERLVAQTAAFAPAADHAIALIALERRGRQLIGEAHHHRRRILREAAMIKTGHAGASAYNDSQSSD